MSSSRRQVTSSIDLSGAKKYEIVKIRLDGAGGDFWVRTGRQAPAARKNELLGISLVLLVVVVVGYPGQLF